MPKKENKTKALSRKTLTTKLI